MDKWLTIGDLLEIEDSYLKNMKGKSLGDMEECCRNILQMWMTPLSWKGVVCLLRDIECSKLAEELVKVLNC